MAAQAQQPTTATQAQQPRQAAQPATAGAGAGQQAAAGTPVKPKPSGEDWAARAQALLGQRCATTRTAAVIDPNKKIAQANGTQIWGQTGEKLAKDTKFLVTGIVASDGAVSASSAKNAALRELEAHRTTLTQMIVHDLRGPLTGIMGHAELLRMKTGPARSPPPSTRSTSRRSA